VISFAAFASLRETAVMGESPACRWGSGLSLWPQRIITPND